MAEAGTAGPYTETTTPTRCASRARTRSTRPTSSSRSRAAWARWTPLLFHPLMGGMDPELSWASLRLFEKRGAAEAARLARRPATRAATLGSSASALSRSIFRRARGVVAVVTREAFDAGLRDRLRREREVAAEQHLLRADQLLERAQRVRVRRQRRVVVEAAQVVRDALAARAR